MGHDEISSEPPAHAGVTSIGEEHHDRATIGLASVLSKGRRAEVYEPVDHGVPGGL
jgi:hypothetical protein